MKTSPLALSLLLALPNLLIAANWPQWRGPARDGFVAKGSIWPDTLGKENMAAAWSVELDEGYSGPIVGDDAVYTVEPLDQEEEVVRRFDRATGEQEWTSQWKGSMKVPFFARKNGSWVRSTPALADGRLYVAGMRDVLVALDATSGKQIWSVDFAEREDTQIPSFGMVCSPLIDGSDLYVQAGCAVTKVNTENGATLWRSMEDRRSMYGSAFSSPIISELNGQRQLLALTREELAGIRLDDGQKLWSYKVKAFRGMNILTPAPWKDTIFTASYGGGSFASSTSIESNRWAVEKSWQRKVEGYMSSPIIRDGHAYLFGRDKRFHCLNIETGDLLWTSEEKFGEYWSMVANGDRILALDEEGWLYYWQATPEKLTSLGKVEVSSKSPTWAHLAVCKDEIYVRDLKGLTKWTWGQ